MNEEYFRTEAEARQRAKDLEACGASASVSFLPTADELGAWLVCWVRFVEAIGCKKGYKRNRKA